MRVAATRKPRRRHQSNAGEASSTRSLVLLILFIAGLCLLIPSFFAQHGAQNLTRGNHDSGLRAAATVRKSGKVTLESPSEVDDLEDSEFDGGDDDDDDDDDDDNNNETEEVSKNDKAAEQTTSESSVVSKSESEIANEINRLSQSGSELSAAMRADFATSTTTTTTKEKEKENTRDDVVAQDNWKKEVQKVKEMKVKDMAEEYAKEQEKQDKEKQEKQEIQKQQLLKEKVEKEKVAATKEKENIKATSSNSNSTATQTTPNPNANNANKPSSSSSSPWTFQGQCSTGQLESGHGDPSSVIFPVTKERCAESCFTARCVAFDYVPNGKQSVHGNGACRLDFQRPGTPNYRHGNGGSDQRQLCLVKKINVENWIVREKQRFQMIPKSFQTKGPSGWWTPIIRHYDYQHSGKGSPNGDGTLNGPKIDNIIANALLSRRLHSFLTTKMKINVIEERKKIKDIQLQKLQDMKDMNALKQADLSTNHSSTVVVNKTTEIVLGNDMGQMDESSDKRRLEATTATTPAPSMYVSVTDNENDNDNGNDNGNDNDYDNGNGGDIEARDGDETTIAVNYPTLGNVEKTPFVVGRLSLGGEITSSYAVATGTSIMGGMIPRDLHNNAGVYPPTEKQFKEFVAEYIDAIKSTDTSNGFMVRWDSPSFAQKEKVLLSKYAPTAVFVANRVLEPFYFLDQPASVTDVMGTKQKPWSRYVFINILSIPYITLFINQNYIFVFCFSFYR